MREIILPEIEDDENDRLRRHEDRDEYVNRRRETREADLAREHTRRRAELRQAEESKKSKKAPKKGQKKVCKKKIAVIVLSILVLAAIITAVVLAVIKNQKNENGEPVAEGSNEPAPTIFYSKLTGLEIVRSGAQSNGLTYTVEEAKAIADAYNAAPTYCMQIPNGADYNRIMAGLDNAAVMYEAVAEAGITRFAMIFQNPTGSAIGPIRSLRMYYLDWDVPYDCTIVHAGGEENARIEAASGKYRDLTESLTYMWRSNYGEYYAPNNLFTDASRLKNFNANAGYKTSDYKAIARQTYETAKKQKEFIASYSKEDGTEKMKEAGLPTDAAKVTSIDIDFGTSITYNPMYEYDAEKNTYLRSYENGDKHTYRICKESEQPKLSSCGKEIQVEASAVAVIQVKEKTWMDRWNHAREDIETTGSGKAWIFQNGVYIPATWKRATRNDQIEFIDSDGNKIEITPGQLWISAIPEKGRVKYE
ncbi:MAG: DUF3048 domain-containing protein [Candidatus Saccharibacteria bacterium]|nr:DUF3048 domain-containing protein [Candidatus Saccharibacteria bacterium]